MSKAAKSIDIFQQLSNFWLRNQDNFSAIKKKNGTDFATKQGGLELNEPHRIRFKALSGTEGSEAPSYLTVLRQPVSIVLGRLRQQSAAFTVPRKRALFGARNSAVHRRTSGIILSRFILPWTFSSSFI
jgi:hypothetical protein